MLFAALQQFRDEGACIESSSQSQHSSAQEVSVGHECRDWLKDAQKGST
jgi:hypothetical protein